VSQRQKQRTNENRARRLGTGEGISRQGRKGAGGRGGSGVPAWAWVVGGAILVAAIAVVVALVVTRGGSSSSGGGQTSPVLKQRNSTSKVDFVSQGTWQPNYTNLAAAISAMHLPEARATMANGDYVTHHHVYIKMYVFDGSKSEQVPIPSQIGVDPTTQTLAPLHTHDDSGVIHIEANAKTLTPPLQDVFNVWGLRFSSTCIGGYCGGVEMWVNGKPNTQFGAYKLQEHDVITIVEGQQPPGFKPTSSYPFAKHGL
jgi:hypothetical protein